MKKLILILAINLCLTAYIKAQNEDDALRYSYMNISGTGRYLGMGGAFGAVGADFSTLSSNPAGIGFYRSNEFSVSPTFFQGKTSSSYLSNTNDDNKYNFNLGNLGLISVSKNENSKWKFIQFGFGLNRYSNFNNRMVIEGYNDKNSLMTHWVGLANGKVPDALHPFDTRLAFDAYLIDTVKKNSTDYFSYLEKGNVLQRKTSTFKGAKNELVFSMGANYDEKLYLGGTVGVPFVNYNETSDYFESDINEKVFDVKNYTVSDKLDDSGIGVNIKLGLIYRVNDWVRLGAAFHSPTFYRINRTFKRTIEANFDNGDHAYPASQKSDFNYHLETPMRAMGSVAFVIGKFGLIDIDYEFTDYSGMKLRDASDGYDYYEENKVINKLYSYQHNIRAGGEVRLEPIYLRAGFGLSTSPYSDSSLDERKSVSFGLGFRDSQYFFDFGYIYTFYKQDYYFYNPAIVDASSNTINNNTLSFTIGYKF